tara:strand:+ start:944 stop:1045 length:102 start_codon:yes stop_codon:yes gene_type:complete
MADKKNNNGAVITAVLVGVVVIGIYAATIMLNA